MVYLHGVTIVVKSPENVSYITDHRTINTLLFMDMFNITFQIIGPNLQTYVKVKVTMTIKYYRSLSIATVQISIDG